MCEILTDHSCFFSVSTGIFDYTAAIISYCLVGAAVFSGEYDGMSVSQLSATISKVRFTTHAQHFIISKL